ncbi:hypothetical protein [Terrisporobacter sp.]
MGIRSKTKLIIRSIILVLTAVLIFINPKLLEKFMGFKLIGNFKIYNLFWMYLMYEMIIVSIPSLNNYSYSGKLFDRHYEADDKYNEDKLEDYTKKNHLRAVRALVFLVLLNGIIGYIYFKMNLSPVYMYLLFVSYYWSDMFCVNV